MNTISGRDDAEWRKLDKLQTLSYANRVKEEGRIFFQKRFLGEKVSKVYYRENMNSLDQLLFDSLIFIAGKTLSVESIIPSYDGKELGWIYGLDIRQYYLYVYVDKIGI